MSIRTDAAADLLSRVADLPSSAAVSFCAWVRLASDLNSYQAFLHMFHSGFGSQDIFLSTDSDGTTLALFDGGATLTGVSMSTGVWYWIGFARSNTTRALFYAAATDAAITVVTDVTTQTITATVTKLYAMNDEYAERVDGNMAFAKLWNGLELSQAQMANERWSVRPNTFANLYGWWPMFPGSGERVRDYSGNGRDWTEEGTITDDDNPPVSYGARSQLIPFVAAAPVAGGWGPRLGGRRNRRVLA